MKTCFLCKRQLTNTDIIHDVSNLLKENIAIPVGMKKNDVICEQCYVKLTNEYRSQRTVESKNNGSGIETGRVEVHDKVLTLEERKALFEKGPPGVTDSTPHFIGHKDEKDGYLWIDGKKVKKHDAESLK